MRNEILTDLSNILSKFETIENLNCCFSKNKVIVQFSIIDGMTLYKIMSAFFGGNIKWTCDITGWMDRGVYVSFYNTITGWNEDDLKGEISYKVCLLKTSLGS